MPALRLVRGEGASLFGIRPSVRLTEAFVFCPIFSTSAGFPLQNTHDIYQLAYERAQESLGFSEYERAQRVCSN